MLADEVGLEVFGIGEHHCREFLDSAPTVLLAAAAVRTRRIRLTSAVTVLSAGGPGACFQEFATLDHPSKFHREDIVILHDRCTERRSFAILNVLTQCDDRDYERLLFVRR